MTVIPSKHTFTIWKGGTFYERIVLFSDSARTTPRNLSGFTSKLRIKPKDSSAIEINGVVTAASGLIEFTYSAASTSSLTWKGATYEMSLTSGGNTDILLFGTVKVLDAA